MKNFDQANNETCDDRELFDRFEHPTLSPDLAERIVQAMSAEHRWLRIHRQIFKFSLPAVAAMVAIVGVFLISKDVSEPVAPSSTVTVAVANDDLTQWAEKEQASEYNLFADLDFESLSSTQTTTDSTDEWDSLFIEVIGG